MGIFSEGSGFSWECLDLNCYTGSGMQNVAWKWNCGSFAPLFPFLRHHPVLVRQEKISSKDHMSLESYASGCTKGCTYVNSAYTHTTAWLTRHVSPPLTFVKWGSVVVYILLFTTFLNEPR